MVKHQQSNNKIKSAFIGGLILLILSASPVAAKVFNAQTMTLDNGLQVIVIPKKTAPAITSMMWYKVGAADEPQGLSGMAHYFEHLMFKGTDKLAPGEFSRIVKKLGGDDNAFTSQDYTAYYQTIAKEYLEKMLSMEADRMVNLAPPPEHFASEKQVVLEERRQRTENDPKGLFFEQMKSALYINHPYGTPVIGWMSEIETYEWEDVKSFYDTWYAPNNAILIISGNVTLEEVKPLVTKIFADIQPKELPPRKRTEIPPSTGDTLMTLHHESINEPAFQTVRLVPSYAQNKQDSLALQVLEEVMSGGATTRLYKNLVVEKKKAISVGLSYDSSSLNESTLWVSGVPTAETSLEELQKLVNDEIQAVIKNGVTETEVNDAIQRLNDAAVFARDSLSSPAMIFGSEITTGSTIDDVENWADNISKITATDIQRVAKTYLDSENPWHRAPITGHLLPLEKKTADQETAE